MFTKQCNQQALNFKINKQLSYSSITIPPTDSPIQKWTGGLNERHFYKEDFVTQHFKFARSPSPLSGAKLRP